MTESSEDTNGDTVGLRSLLDEHSVDSASSLPEDVQLSIAVARHLQTRANALQTPQERRQQAELDRMIQSPSDKVTMIQMTDQAFRARTPNRAVDQLVHILDVQGVPRFFTPFDRALLMGFQSFGSYLPGVAVPMVKEKMQQETANVILPAEPDLLAKHLQARRDAGWLCCFRQTTSAEVNRMERSRRRNAPITLHRKHWHIARVGLTSNRESAR